MLVRGLLSDTVVKRQTGKGMQNKNRARREREQFLITDMFSSTEKQI